MGLVYFRRALPEEDVEQEIYESVRGDSFPLLLMVVLAKLHSRMLFHECFSLAHRQHTEH